MKKTLVPTVFAALLGAGTLAVPAVAQVTLDIGGGSQNDNYNYDRYDRPREGRSVTVEPDGERCHWRRVRYERPNGDIVIRRERVCVRD